MKTIQTINALQFDLGQISEHAKKLALVPTMGNLHVGHLKLVELAKRHSDAVVVSIFINPLQFGANEDLDDYPRTLQADCEKLEALGVDVVFAPSVTEMYPMAQTMQISAPPIANTLCGASRPGHFDGVATIVMKLFNIVQPDIAVFGKKDYQQLLILKQLVQQFNVPVEIIAAEIEREADGLAMSSRNGYLNKMERSEAVRLHKCLKLVVQSAQKGDHSFESIEQQTTDYMTQLGWKVDYIAIRSAETLEKPKEGEKKLIALGAAQFGRPRLIDNIEFLR